MTFFKLFVKLFTNILLILTFTMQPNGSYQLQNTGVSVIYSVHGCWKKHGDAKFVGLMQTLNNHYRIYMEKDIYLTIFEDATTKAKLKRNALDLVNDWYCQQVLDILNQVDPSPKAITMMNMIKKIPCSYQARNGDYLILDSLKDFGFMLDYYFDDNNGSNERI